MFLAPTSYVNAVQSGLDPQDGAVSFTTDDATQNSNLELCPYAAHGQCNLGDQCSYFHGNICDICGQAVLLPDNPEQNEKHKKVSYSVCFKGIFPDFLTD